MPAAPPIHSSQLLGVADVRLRLANYGHRFRSDHGLDTGCFTRFNWFYGCDRCHVRIVRLDDDVTRL